MYLTYPESLEALSQQSRLLLNKLLLFEYRETPDYHLLKHMEMKWIASLDTCDERACYLVKY